MSRILKVISEWKNLILAVLVILIIDLIVTLAFGSYIHSNVPFIFGSSNKDTFAALLFFEGAVFLGVGAWIASGYSEVKIIQKDNPAATGYLAEKLFPQREEYRKRQIFTGLMLILIGAALLTVAYLIYLTIP